MLIDTHCHLDAGEFAADRDRVIERACAAGVGAMVVPGVTVSGIAGIDALCAQHPCCRPACGIHPLYVGNATEGDLDQLRQRLGAGKVVAVGEIGLDYFVEGFDRARQEFFFAEQLKVAREYDLPVLLHTRRANDDVLKHLRRIRVPGGIAHAFSGSRQQADMFIALGFKLGFGGAFTWSRATRLRELAATLPLDSMVLETDAPDIPPQWIGHGRNAPEELPQIARELAKLRDAPADQIALATTANARCVLPGLVNVKIA